MLDLFGNPAEQQATNVSPRRPAMAFDKKDPGRVDVLSLGMGRQSTALLLMSLVGDFPRYDYAVFSDLWSEPTYVYEYLDFLQDYCKREFGFEITVLDNRNIIKDIVDFKAGKLGRFDMIPAFVKLDNKGNYSKLFRICTSEYKIYRIRKWFVPIRAGRDMLMSFGIPLDEKERAAKVNNQKKAGYMHFNFPAIDRKLFTWDLMKIFDRLGIDKPRKSSCVFCPFHADSYWTEMYKNRPDEFEVSVQVDRLVRHWPGLENELYLHRSCKPLEDLPFLASQGTDLFYLPNGDCTSGICGV